MVNIRKWNPLDDFGKKIREDGAGIVYSPNHGYWNGNPNLEIAFDSLSEYVPEHHPSHYHKYMEEVYAVIEGSGTLLVNEEEECEMKPKDILKIKPGEIHRIFSIEDPKEYGPLTFYLVKTPSVEGDKFVVEPTYKKEY